ncbi:hypothetical protein DXG01_012404 [Tephrocybe rancida]|nr:hypothetical protein DXG01_012404 [Tephrocybe rancida]
MCVGQARMCRDLPRRVLMAQAQRLSDQVKALNARVRELEGALSRSGASEVRNEGLNIGHREPSHADGVESVSEAIGSLSLGLDGQAKYHGESAGSERDEKHQAKQPHLNLPDEILNLMHAFPFGFKDCPYNKSIFIRYLPHKERAMELAYVYYASVAWMYDPIPFQDFVASIINPIYGSEGYPTTDAVHSHRLAVFFMILANGNLYDETQPDATNVAEQYYALARAALSLDSILIEVTCSTVQALFLVFRFIYNSSQSDKEERWLLTGLATRIAQTIGLQRDSAAWNLDPQEVQRRRHLFWELFVWENWSSLVHGRPGSLFIQHADCRYPEDLHQVGDIADEGSLGFHAWKFRYSAKCMSMSVEHVFSTRYPTYSALLAIDDVIRNFPIPKHLRWPENENGYDWSCDPSMALQQYCTLCVRDSNLMYIHRSYFAQAIREASDDPLRHKYRKSVVATFQTSRRLISVLKDLYPVNSLCRHVWFFWSGFFSSCVVLGALVVESPGCSLADKAMRELKDAIPFFAEGSNLCRPPSVLNFLQTLHRRAYAAYTDYRSGQKPRGPSTQPSSSEPDALEVLGGRHAVITTKSNPNSPSQVSASPSTLHQEAAGSSPIPRHAAPAGYYAMDTSPTLTPKTHYDHQMEDAAMHRFEDHAYSSIGKALHDSRGVSNSYVANHGVVGAPSDIHLARPQRDQSVIGIHKEGWNYSGPHDPFPGPPQTTNTHQPSPPYLPYVHGHNPAVQGAHPGSPYEYPARPLQEPTAQNQDEIWRSFMMGYGP